MGIPRVLKVIVLAMLTIGVETYLWLLKRVRGSSIFPGN